MVNEHLDMIPFFALVSGVDYTITPHATESGIWVVNMTYTPHYQVDYIHVDIDLTTEEPKPFVPKEVWELIDIDGDEE